MPIDLERGLDRAARAAIDALPAQSRSVQSEREKQQVATISAHNDPAIGELVAQAIEKVGAEGAVTVEEAKGTEMTMEVVTSKLRNAAFRCSWLQRTSKLKLSRR